MSLVKHLALVLLLGVVAASLVACGGDKKKEVTQAELEQTAIARGPGNPVSLNTTALAGQTPGTTATTGDASTTPGAASPAAGTTSEPSTTTPSAGATLPVASPPTTRPATPTQLPLAGDATVSATGGSGNKDAIVEVVVSAQGNGNVKLGGWTIDLEYDPSQLSADGCSIGEDAVCNAKFNDRTIRLVGIALNGKSGEVGRGKFKLTGAPGTNATVQVKPNQCITPEGAPLTCPPISVTVTIR